MIFMDMQPDFHWSNKTKRYHCDHDLTEMKVEYKEKWERDEYGCMDGKMVMVVSCPKCGRKEDIEL